jgi:hypothetical protein
MPAGLLQAADAACSAEHCGGSSLAGSKRGRSDADDTAAADDDVVDADAGDDVHDENLGGGRAGRSKHQHQQVLQSHKQAKQQELPQAWAAAAAAGGAAGKFQQQHGQQSRLSRMSQADHHHQQQGPGISRKPSNLHSSLFNEAYDSVGGAFSRILPGGARFTDLTQVRLLSLGLLWAYSQQCSGLFCCRTL